MPAETTERKDVWKNVETYVALDAAGDTKGFLAYFHADYKGWGYSSPLPGSKERATKFLTYEHKTQKTLVFDLQPVTVQVYGDTAFAHYFFTRTFKNSEGKEEREIYRWTDILRKQGDKWMLVGDHGGVFPPKP